jgi:hypothetical protein
MPSVPGIDVGGPDRRESGKLPDGGAGGTVPRGGGMDGGTEPELSPTDDGDRDAGGSEPPRGDASGARVGGGTNARRAIGLTS